MPRASGAEGHRFESCRRANSSGPFPPRKGPFLWGLSRMLDKPRRPDSPASPPLDVWVRTVCFSVAAPAAFGTAGHDLLPQRLAAAGRSPHPVQGHHSARQRARRGALRDTCGASRLATTTAPATSAGVGASVARATGASCCMRRARSPSAWAAGQGCDRSEC